jgi:23S rRNA (uracil1939-C5)-methyltransferase
VEGVRSSAADAKASIKKGRVENVEVLANPIHRAMRRLQSERPDAVILNPSAAGADPPTLEMIVRSPARRVAYLSCDPATLARDLAVLINGGFGLVSVQAIDMMPQTRQVEALAFLRR